MSLLQNVHRVVAVFLSFAVPFLPARDTAHPEGRTEVKSILLVHGAKVGGSSWAKIIPILESKGFHVTAVQIPLTSASDDIAAKQRAAPAKPTRLFSKPKC